MKNQIRSLLYNINKYLFSGNKFYCNICDRHYRKFFSAGENRRANARCPGCGSFERHRLMRKRQIFFQIIYLSWILHPSKLFINYLAK